MNSADKKINKTNGKAFALTTLLFGIAVSLFFALAYPHHLHFQEQYQLFLFEKEYAIDVLSIPGGLADLIGRFLTQFFLYARIGAIIVAVVLICIQLLTYRLLRTSKGEILPYALSFIPSIICCCFLCDQNALMTAPIALLIVLILTLLIQSIGSDNWRQALSFICIPLSYLLVGGFFIPFVIILIIGEIYRERSFRVLAITCIFLIAVIATPLAWHRFVHYSLFQLFSGPHYYRNPEEVAYWAWYSVCAVVLLALLPKRLRTWAPKRSTLVLCLSWIVLMVIGGYSVNSHQSKAQEDIMAYDFLARNAMWNRIIIKAKMHAPRNQISAVALNLALSQRNMLAKYALSFPQNGIAGLLPNFQSDYISPLVTSEAFYRLGMINTAQRFVFEAQEAIPDFQKSARCYKRLAETNLINGDYEVARKYLLALQKTLFYSSWATETLALIENDEAVNAHPEYGKLRKSRCNEDYFFGGNDIHMILQKQLQSNPENSTAFEYLEAVNMLIKPTRQ